MTILYILAMLSLAITFAFNTAVSIEGFRLSGTGRRTEALKLAKLLMDVDFYLVPVSVVLTMAFIVLQ